MDKKLKAELDGLRRSFAEDGEKLAFDAFPRKVLSLHQLVLAAQNPTSPFHVSNAVSSSEATLQSATESNDRPAEKKRKREEDEGGVVYTNDISANHLIMDLHKAVRQEAEELADQTSRLAVWISMTIPKIEDGDNFGVQVQEEVLQEIYRTQEAAANIRNVPLQSHLARAKICSKLIKYPNVEDYKEALRQHDEKSIFSAHQSIVDLRNMYATLTDLVQKNIIKIRAPKANNSTSLY